MLHCQHKQQPLDVSETKLDYSGRCRGLMVSLLDSRMSGSDYGSGWGHFMYVVVLGKTLYLCSPRCTNEYW